MSYPSLKAYLPDEASTLAFGKKLGLATENAAVIFLHGSLGAGKTTLVRGILRGLGYEGHVKSPTYTLVEAYQTQAERPIFHFDLYRLSDPEELEYIGIADYFMPQALSFIEWPEKGLGKLPKPDMSCYIDQESNGRTLTMVGETAVGQAIIQRLQHAD